MKAMGGKIVTILVFGLLALIGSVASAQDAKPSVFVGPQMRDGFADVDAGIRDSIHDVRQEFQSANFRIAVKQEEATLVVLVIARGIVTNGSVGFSSSSNSSTASCKSITSRTYRNDSLKNTWKAADRY